jgi:hypothetical protein
MTCIAADRVLYRAKQYGRNRVSVANWMADELAAENEYVTNSS